jgi:short-subunit dehydrogenase
MRKKVCLITGVGPGTGTALVKRFSEHYKVAMLARNADRLDALAEEITDAYSFPCDVSDSAELNKTLAAVKVDLGLPAVVIHNAVGGAFGSFLDIDPQVLQRNFQVNTMALLQLAQQTAPAMIEAEEGAIICTGNTSAFRGSANFAGFAPTKAAQRILAEAMARDLGPKGVHVAYVAIDAVIDLAWTRERYPDKHDGFFCQPGDIAEECYRLAHQNKSAWSFSSVIRPYGETW